MGAGMERQLLSRLRASTLFHRPLQLRFLFVSRASAFAFAGVQSSAGMFLFGGGRVSFVLLGSVGSASTRSFAGVLAGTGVLGVGRRLSLGRLPVILRGRIDAAHRTAE